MWGPEAGDRIGQTVRVFMYILLSSFRKYSLEVSLGFAISFVNFSVMLLLKNVVYKKACYAVVLSFCMVLFPNCPVDVSLYVVEKLLRGSKIITR